MRCKCCLNSQEVYKWKARLTLYVSYQIKSRDYWETYAPVDSWTVIRWALTISIINNWKSRQLNHVMAYIQAQPIKDGAYMAVPKGFEVNGDQSPQDYALKVNTNLYGGCDAGRPGTNI